MSRPTATYRKFISPFDLQKVCIRLAAATIFFPGVAFATFLDFDASGNHPSDPTYGTGNWDTETSANWTTRLANAVDIPWINGSTAFFDSPGSIGAYAVTIDDTAGTVVAAAIEPIEDEPVTISAIPGDTLTLGGTPGAGGSNPFVGGPLTVNAPIAGTAGLQVNYGALSLTGVSNYTGLTNIESSASITLANGAGLGNTPIFGAGSFYAAGSAFAGTTGPGTSGARIGFGLGASSALSYFSMVDGNAGTFTLNQQSAFTGPSLYATNSTFAFDLTNSKADELLNSGPGTASVSGANEIDISTSGDTSLTLGNYTLINWPNGGLTGTFVFNSGPPYEGATVNGVGYNLTLTNSDTAEVLTVSLPEPSFILPTVGLGLLLRRRSKRSEPIVTG